MHNMIARTQIILVRLLHYVCNKKFWENGKGLRQKNKQKRTEVQEHESKK